LNRGLDSTYRALARSDLIAPAVLVEALFDSGQIRFWTGLGDLVVGGVTYNGAGELLSISPTSETQNVRANGAQIGLTGISSALVSIALNEPCQGRPVSIKMIFLPSDAIPYIDLQVTVASGKFVIEKVSQDVIYVNDGETYRFDQSDSSFSGHNLRISTTSDGTFTGGSQYTNGWTEVGTPGTAGAYNQWVVPAGVSASTPTMYYYCQNHSGMGGTVKVTGDRPYLNPFILFDGFMDKMTIQDSGEKADITIACESALIALQKAKVRRYTAEDQKIDNPLDLGFDFVPDIQDLVIVWGRS
tara:strand:+ start:519 stop:1421 length:903 start_codon:yes stop_codon:yes gene_type:complete